MFILLGKLCVYATVMSVMQMHSSKPHSAVVAAMNVVKVKTWCCLCQRHLTLQLNILCVISLGMHAHSFEMLSATRNCSFYWTMLPALLLTVEACEHVHGCGQVGTAQYDREYQAVKLYGAKNSTARDPYQQLTPYFWADDVSKFFATLTFGFAVLLLSKQQSACLLVLHALQLVQQLLGRQCK